jgi:hypothetical protein
MSVETIPWASKFSLHCVISGCIASKLDSVVLLETYSTTEYPEMNHFMLRLPEIDSVVCN